MTFQDVETARQAYWDFTKKSLLISGIIVIVAIAIMFIDIQGFDLSYALAICLIAIAISSGTSYLLGRKYATAYHKAYKGYFVEQSFRKIFTDLTYSHQKGLPASLLSATGMLDLADAYSSNDLTVAKYKGVGFTQADATIERITVDSEGHPQRITIFKGRIMFFEFPKRFNFKLELIGKKFHAYRIPKRDAKTSRQMVKISTESSDFNRSFRIFGQDGFETFYLLDPSIMIKIQAIAERHNHRILLGFLDNKMLVAISDGKDSFEPAKISKPINEATELAKVASEIQTITSFVDDLSLAPIFSK